MKLNAALFALLPCLAFGEFGLLPDGHLDMPSLSSAYAESEFAKVSEVLEAYDKHAAGKATHEERVFTFKHLGVIYAADSATLPRAESYFNRLLNLAPNIELVDMYVSPKIQRVFQRVKDDFRAQAAYKSKFDAFGNPHAADTRPPPVPSSAGSTDSPPPPRKPRLSKNASPPEKSRTWVWWAGGLLTVGAGVGLYLWTQDPGESTRTRDIDGGLGGG